MSSMAPVKAAWVAAATCVTSTTMAGAVPPAVATAFSAPSSPTPNTYHPPERVEAHAALFAGLRVAQDR